MNTYKQQIFENIKNDTPELISSDMIDEYLLKYPGDTETLVIKAYLNMLNDNINDAIDILNFVLKKCPFDIDALFLLGQAYNETGDFYNALICLGKSDVISAHYENKASNISIYKFYNHDICQNIINQIMNNVLNNLQNYSQDEIIHISSLMHDAKKHFDDLFDLFEDIIRTNRDYIGETFSNNPDDIRFCASYNTTDFFKQKLDVPKNLFLYKLEMLKQFKTGTEITFELKTTSLVPILAYEELTVMEIIAGNKKPVPIAIKFNMHFNYYKMPSGKVSILSNKPLIIGDPVPLIHNKKNKKLVISLFVDGLSQYIFDQFGLENIMPHTYNFFKKGMICKNAFTSSDWTYPSLSSMISGQYVPNHMMIHPQINIKFQKDQKLLFEYFKEAGYHTSMISGEWRSCATYDSIRGIDRYIALHPASGFRTEDVVNNAIDNIETFKGTDQYLWIGAGELHDIADEFNLPSAVQASMNLEDFHITENVINSVKQGYNQHKIEAYKRYAHNIDLKLQTLYNYIEENFNDDEFVISIFGDHGQAYFVKPDKYHLSRGLSNICFMTRGGHISGTSGEYINITDYTNIITKLSGIENIQIDSDGVLPKTYGGTYENKFAITETVHPGDPYMAAIHNPLTQYGKVDLSTYETKLLNNDGIEIHDQHIIDKFTDYILERTKYIQIY